MLNNVIILGYSGHSFVCIECAILNRISVLGYCDSNIKDFNPFKLEYLGHENDYIQDSHNIFIALGNNTLRENIFKKFKPNNYINLIHPTAIVSKISIIKPNSNILILAGVIVNPLAEIEEGVILNTNSTIEHECMISAFAHIAPGATLAGNVFVGERTFIGANSTVKQGVKIGSDVIIGAGSVIINDVPNGVVVVGNPGKIIKQNI